MSAIINWPNREAVAVLKTNTPIAQMTVLAMVALTFLARGIRARVERRRDTVRVTYPDGAVIAAAPGASILEISRMGGIPHASICGGRGRCSTCRVRVNEGGDGLQTGPEEACRQAVIAARNMSLSLIELNRSLSTDLEKPFRIGIGMHIGSAIVGEIGYGRAANVTAIGDTVNTASRLEPISKEFSSELVLSEELVKKAGISLDGFPQHEVELRGRSATVQVRAVERASNLPEI